MSNIQGYIIMVITILAGFLIPTLTVASNWGIFEASQQQIIKRLDKIEYKVDDTRDRVMKLEGRD